MKTSKLEIFYDGKLILSLSPNDDLMHFGTVMRTVNDSCELIDPVGDEDE